MAPSGDRPRLLVFNCHEAWVYQLHVLPFDLDVIVGLPGRHTLGWDERIRPVPENARLITLRQALEANTPYHCTITHNITDLLDVKNVPGPRLHMLHMTLDGLFAQEGGAPYDDGRTMRQMLSHYLDMLGGHAVAVSELKGRSWGLAEDIVHFGIDCDDYPPYSGEKAAGLRVSNFLTNRAKVLNLQLHRQAFGDLAVRIVGHNPDMPGVEASRDWDDLKRILSTHRFFIHTADPTMEDGLNMAVGEAMAAGMPVVGNHNPSSLIVHGESGFLSDDPTELRRYARRLLDDRGLAARMGSEARRIARERLCIQLFRERFCRSIETARRKWAAGRVEM